MSSGKKEHSGIKRTYSGDIAIETETRHNLGFGEFSRFSYTETSEGRKFLNAVQKAAVGTEITVSSSNRWGTSQEEIYRITGTTHNKRLVAVNKSARESLAYEGLDSITLTNRDDLRLVLSPQFENGKISVHRKPLSEQESREIKAERKWERQRRAAEKRQYKINFD